MQISDLPHHVLALYGEIDKQVLEARKRDTPTDRAIVALVERMLPGTTGFAQAGWYQELERFASRRWSEQQVERATPDPPTFPGFAESIEFLRAPAARSAKDTGTPPPGPPPPTNRRLDNPTTERDPAYAKATYAAVVLEKIKRLKGSDQQLLSEPLNNIGNVLAGWLPTTDLARIDQTFRTRIATDEGRSAASEDLVGRLIDRVDEINDRALYRGIVGTVVSPEMASASLPCFGTLEESGGLYCSTLYTDYCFDDLSVDDVANIVHPLNWPLCSNFFGGMEARAPKYDRRRWSRIRETIGAERQEYCLKTSLVFDFADHRIPDASAPHRPRGVVINYELDAHREDDGIVEVDNGYLWITPTNTANDPSAPGVRIRSSKQERINGLSPTATSALGCILGWGAASEAMLAGTARTYRDDPSCRPQFLAFPSGVGAAGVSKGSQSDIDDFEPGPEVEGPATLPPNFADTVGDLQTVLTDLIERVAAVAGAGAELWRDGLSHQDVVAVATSAGQNLTEWADATYEIAERNVINKDQARAGNGA